MAARDVALEAGLAVLALLLMLSLIVIVRFPSAAGGTRAATVDEPAGSAFGGTEPSPGPLATGPLGGTLVAPARPHRGEVKPAHGRYAGRHGRGHKA